MSEGSELLQEGNLLTPDLLLHKNVSVDFIKLFKPLKCTTNSIQKKANKTTVSGRWLGCVKVSAAKLGDPSSVSGSCMVEEETIDSLVVL